MVCVCLFYCILLCFCAVDADDSDDRVSVASEPDQLLYGRPSSDSAFRDVTLARAFSEGHSPAHNQMGSGSEVNKPTHILAIFYWL